MRPESPLVFEMGGTEILERLTRKMNLREAVAGEHLGRWTQSLTGW